MQNEWVKVTPDTLPVHGRKVIAVLTTSYGKRRRIMAQYADANTIENSEGGDEEYAPEGWYEMVESSDDPSCFSVDGEVTHWMPLPPLPTDATADRDGGEAGK